MSVIKAFLIALCASAIAVHALAKPSADGGVRTQRSRSAEVDSAIAASFLGQAGVRYSPEAVGLSVEYQRAMLRGWVLTAGGDLGLHEARTLVAPFAGLEHHLLTVGPLEVHGGGGLAVPMQLLPDSTATALALRGVAGARWKWSLVERLVPHVQLVGVAGPMLFPDNVRPSAYLALQLMLGASYDL